MYRVLSGVIIGAIGVVLFSYSEHTFPNYKSLVAQSSGVLNTLGIPSTMATQGDLNILNGGCGYDPYKVLAQYGCKPGNSYEGCIPGPGGQGGINSGLACRLTKLFEAAAKAGCRPQIVSAFRSAAKQQALCGGGRSGCAAAGKSCHQYGLAVDVSCPDLLRKMAPQFQLHFPYYGPHIQCIEHKVAACNPSTPPCKGGGPINNGGDTASPGNGAQGPTQSTGSPQTGGGQQGGDQGAGSSQQSPQNPNDLPPQQPFEKKDGEVKDTDQSAEITLSCEPESILSGESSKITWECPEGTRSKGSSSNSLSLFDTKSKISGTSSVTPKKNTTYTVQCTKAGKVVGKQSCDVRVDEKKLAMTVQFEVTPLEVSKGDVVEISWTSKNARSCAIKGPNFSSSDKSGRATSEPITKESQFSITCKPKVGNDVYTQTETVTLVSDAWYDEAVDPTSTSKQGSTKKTEQTTFTDPLQEI